MFPTMFRSVWTGFKIFLHLQMLVHFTQLFIITNLLFQIKMKHNSLLTEEFRKMRIKEEAT